jgi:subtilisin-like proprotein convertase family protein
LHTYVSDLTMNLIAPNGEKIILVQNTGGSGNNFTNTIFSDTAETEIGSSNPPFSGTFRPLESFEKFKGKSSLGNWTLEIIDSYEQDVGSLVAFSLQFCLQGILAENSDQDTVVDALDNCPFVVNDDQNDYDSDGVGDVCDLDGQNNFSIYKKDESCIGKANGSLQVEVLADFNYTVNLVGPSGYRQNFTMNGSGLTVNNLAAGDYLLCITSPEDTNFERCFSTNIASPELMQVQSVVHEPSQSLDLNVSGTTAYEVLLNGKKVNASLLEQKRIPLQKGANYLKVINTASCQDIF